VNDVLHALRLAPALFLGRTAKKREMRGAATFEAD